jgi:hypothetical protein
MRFSLNFEKLFGLSKPRKFSKIGKIAIRQHTLEISGWEDTNTNPRTTVVGTGMHYQIKNHI